MSLPIRRLPRSVGAWISDSCSTWESRTTSSTRPSSSGTRWDSLSPTTLLSGLFIGYLVRKRKEGNERKRRHLGLEDLKPHTKIFHAAKLFKLFLGYGTSLQRTSSLTPSLFTVRRSVFFGLVPPTV